MKNTDDYSGWDSCLNELSLKSCISLPQRTVLLICLQARQIHGFKQDVGKESHMKPASPDMISAV